MTPKEKAIELYNKFCNMRSHCDDAQECALIAVDEILQSHYALLTGIKPSTYNYWQEIKEEIEKL